MKLKLISNVFIVLIFFTGSICYGAGFVSPISPVDEVRQEVGYSYSEVDFTSKTAADMVVKQSALYAQVEFPVLDAAAFYVRLGAANIDLGTNSGITLIDDRYRPYGGVGLKWVLGSNPYANIGCFVEGNYYSRYKEEFGATRLEYEGLRDMTAGLAIQLQTSGLGVYIGPVGSLSAGEYESSVAGASAKYRSETKGIQAGVKIPLGSIAHLTLDGVFGDRQVWGGSINFVGPSL